MYSRTSFPKLNLRDLLNRSMRHLRAWDSRSTPVQVQIDLRFEVTCKQEVLSLSVVVGMSSTNSSNKPRERALVRESSLYED